MKPSTFQSFLDEHSDRLAELKRKKIFVIDSLTGGTGGLLADSAGDVSADLFSVAGDGDDDSGDTVVKKAMDVLITSDYLAQYPTPVLIDFAKAVSLYLSSGRAADDDEEGKIKTALTMSRVNFMGTDGIRGKIVLNHNENDFLSALLKDNAFTPDLVTITSYSFATLLLSNNIVQPGDTLVLGNDGRDLATNWKLNSSVIDGFTRAGLNVLDTGVVPTAIVPWKMLQLNHKGGACLTASHNPSNQNGIKFFIDGKKLLPEGRPVGDFALSALMFNYCRVEAMPSSPPSHNNSPAPSCTSLDVQDDAVQWMLDVLPDNMKDILTDVILVYDSANGATEAIGHAVLTALDATYTTKNERPTGTNINHQCGVAEIEGIDLFKGAEYESCIPFVREIFDKGRANNEAGRKVYGISLDGDGDRGFLLYYDSTHDVVHVLDGDKCGYILAEYMIATQNIVNPSEYWFLSTIESDLMTATAAATNLGLNTKVVSVGDKWIGNFTEGTVLVGLEISGHLIFPIEVEAKDGTTKTLLSGVGLLTGLMSLAAILTLKLDEERIVQPFEPGFSNTYYVYFVDKSRHYRGSELWNQDIALVEEATQRLLESGDLPADTRLVYEDKEDLNVLYINVTSGEELLGCIFMRNSGTEDKNATYVKGQKRYETALTSIGRKIQQLHLNEMKNGTRIECTYERFLMKAIEDADGGTTAVEEVMEQIRADGVDVSETDLFGVVHAMKKEGRIAVEGRTLKAK